MSASLIATEDRVAFESVVCSVLGLVFCIICLATNHVFTMHLRSHIIGEDAVVSGGDPFDNQACQMVQVGLFSSTQCGVKCDVLFKGRGSWTCDTEPVSMSSASTCYAVGEFSPVDSLGVLSYEFCGGLSAVSTTNILLFVAFLVDVLVQFCSVPLIAFTDCHIKPRGMAIFSLVMAFLQVSLSTVVVIAQIVVYNSARANTTTCNNVDLFGKKLCSTVGPSYIITYMTLAMSAMTLYLCIRRFNKGDKVAGIETLFGVEVFTPPPPATREMMPRTSLGHPIRTMRSPNGRDFTVQSPSGNRYIFASHPDSSQFVSDSSRSEGSSQQSGSTVSMSATSHASDGTDSECDTESDYESE